MSIAEPVESRAPIDDVAEEPVPYLIIRPTRGLAALDLSEIWRYRDLLYTLAQRDVKVRYKQTALGVIWVVLQPLLAAGIFSFVFGKVARLPTDGVPAFIFSFAGLLGWNLFAHVLSRTSGCLVGNTHLVSKVFFPRLVLPLSSLGSVLIDFGVALGMMAAIMVLNAQLPTWTVLLLPVWMGLVLVLALGVGLWTAALTVSYRDVQYVLPVAVQMAMYASPVAYSVMAVPERYRTLYYLNPLAGLMDAFRWSMLGVTHTPEWWAVGYSAALAVALLVWGAAMFKKMERKFADVI